jgi:hypothetical protein
MLLMLREIYIIRENISIEITDRLQLNVTIRLRTDGLNIHTIASLLSFEPLTTTPVKAATN